MALMFWRGSTALVVVVAACASVFLVVTKPDPLPDSHWASLKAPDVKRGETVFWMAGCSSCHAAKGAAGDAKLILSGGRDLKTPFGVFHVPNISPDKNSGIGRWTLAQFGNAVKRGVGANGEHLYPAFPYGSYSRMTDTDVVDLFGYIRTLTKSDNAVPPHDLPFPFNIRMLLGGWKFLFLSEGPRIELSGANDSVRRGQYIVEGPGHCGECHTPRNAVGGLKEDLWLAGAPNPEGQGSIPDITPGSKAIGAWSEADITTYLETGMTPEFDSVGGSMVEVQQNLAHLPTSDREAIAAYLKAIPPK